MPPSKLKVKSQKSKVIEQNKEDMEKTILQVETPTTIQKSVRETTHEPITVIEEPVKVAEAAFKAVKTEKKTKYIPLNYRVQKLSDAEIQEDGTTIRRLMLTDPIVPEGETLDLRYKNIAQVVRYRDNRRISCQIIGTDGEVLKTLNTAMLD